MVRWRGLGPMCDPRGELGAEAGAGRRCCRESGGCKALADGAGTRPGLSRVCRRERVLRRSRQDMDADGGRSKGRRFLGPRCKKQEEAELG